MTINRSSKEREFELLLENHPYLIDNSLVDGRIEEQYSITLDNGDIRFIDLIYFKEKEITVIELKRDALQKKDISQLSEYVNHVKKLFPEQKIYGILVGQFASDEILRFLELRDFKYKQYFRDIPVRIKICSNCRKAVDMRKSKCNWCGSIIFFK